MSYEPAPQWRPAPLPVAPNGLPLADFGTRFLAYLIDYAILFVVMMVAWVPAILVFFAIFVNQMPRGRYDDRTFNPGVFFLSWICMFVYILFITLGSAYAYRVEYQLRRGGQTVGKNVMKIRVIPVTPGATLTRQDLVKRWGVENVIAAFVPFFSLLDGLWQLWDKPLLQCLHDKAAGTVVVKTG